MNTTTEPPPPTPRLAIVQHHPAEHCGEVALWAQARGVALDVYRADLEHLPLNIAVSTPLLLLGGPYPLNVTPNKLPWLHAEQQWLATVVARGHSVFGICLGAQLLCMARGDRVSLMPQTETGWTTITLESDLQIDALQWHEDECILPEDACITGFSKRCPTQAFAFINASGSSTQLGLQFHPEWNAQLVDELNHFFDDASPLPRGPDAARFAAIKTWFWSRLDTWWDAHRNAPQTNVRGDQ